MKYFVFAILALVCLTQASHLRNNIKSEQVQSFFSFLESGKINDQMNIQETIKVLLESGKSYDAITKLLNEIEQSVNEEIAQIQSTFDEESASTSNRITKNQEDIASFIYDIDRLNSRVLELRQFIAIDSQNLTDTYHARNISTNFLNEITSARKAEREAFAIKKSKLEGLIEVLKEIYGELQTYKDTGNTNYESMLLQLKSKSKLLSPIMALVQLSTKFDENEYADLMSKINELIQAFSKELVDSIARDEESERIFIEKKTATEADIEAATYIINYLIPVIASNQDELAQDEATIVTKIQQKEAAIKLVAQLEAYLEQLKLDFNEVMDLKSRELATLADVRNILSQKEEQINKYEIPE